MTRALQCPICHKAVEPPAPGVSSAFPFCSDRCRQVDLLRWSKGQYAIVEPARPEHLPEEPESDQE
jgi:hypothetical protein